MDAVDLYLLHWPHELRLESWRVLEQLHDEGLARSIGVSNFLLRHLDELLPVASVPPAVNQIELSPFLFRSREDTIRRCEEDGIALEAYSPLTKGRTAGRLHRRVDRDRGEADIGAGAHSLVAAEGLHRASALVEHGSHRRERRRLRFQAGRGADGGLDALDEGLTTG